MSTNFPTNLDALTNPTATDKVSVVSHADQHANANDAIEALQEKVGVDSSAVTTSHDFKLSNVGAGDKAASVTGTETLTNKTLTTPVITSIKPSAGNTQTLQDATDTIVSRDTTDTLTNKTLMSPTLNTPTLSAPVLNGSITGTGVLDEDNMSSDSATALATQQSIKAYVDNSVTSGQPNSFSVNSITTGQVSYTDEFYLLGNVGGVAAVGISTETSGLAQQLDTSSSTWTDANTANNGWVILNGYIYIMLEDSGTSPDTFRVYRYDLSNITSAGTLMTFAGATTLSTTDSAMKMASDGTNFYFDYEAGNSANQYAIAKYTLSGTTLTYDSTITLSDSATWNGNFIVNSSSGDIFTSDNTNGVSRYNSSGTLQENSIAYLSSSTLLNFSQTNYIGNASSDVWSKLL